MRLLTSSSTFTALALGLVAAGCSACAGPKGGPIDTGPADTTAPSVPTDLQASVSAGVVSLTWTPSTDDVEVASYNVYRDGIESGHADGPDYADTRASIWTTVAYTVTALDDAGNESAPSEAVSIAVDLTAADVAGTWGGYPVYSGGESWSDEFTITFDVDPAGSVAGSVHLQLLTAGDGGGMCGSPVDTTITGQFEGRSLTLDMAPAEGSFGGHLNSGVFTFSLDSVSAASGTFQFEADWSGADTQNCSSNIAYTNGSVEVGRSG